jgi:hypothetical protein
MEYSFSIGISIEQYFCRGGLPPLQKKKPSHSRGFFYFVVIEKNCVIPSSRNITKTFECCEDSQVAKQSRYLLTGSLF